MRRVHGCEFSMPQVFECNSVFFVLGSLPVRLIFVNCCSSGRCYLQSQKSFRTFHHKKMPCRRFRQRLNQERRRQDEAWTIDKLLREYELQFFISNQFQLNRPKKMMWIERRQTPASSSSRIQEKKSITTLQAEIVHLRPSQWNRPRPNLSFTRDKTRLKISRTTIHRSNTI